MGTGSKVILDGVEKGVGAIGTKGDAAAAGAVTTTDTLVAYIKQLVTAQQAVATGLGVVQYAIATVNLNQAAASYDLLIGTGQVGFLTGLSFKMPAEAAGGALTSISIQTDEVTPGVIINSTDGDVANLTSEADLAWTGLLRIDVGTKIQLTIGGGAHGSSLIPTIVARYEAIIAGGTLA